jgi:hypothetical protein
MEPADFDRFGDSCSVGARTMLSYVGNLLFNDSYARSRFWSLVFCERIVRTKTSRGSPWLRHLQFPEVLFQALGDLEDFLARGHRSKHNRAPGCFAT